MSPHELTVAAIDATGRGPSAPVVTFTPRRVELSTDTWSTVDAGGANWTFSGQTINADYASGSPSYLAMVDPDPALPNPDWSDVSVSAEFRLGCSCAPGSTNTNPCGRVGLATRYQSDADHVKAYLEYDANVGCYVRIASMASGVLARSPNIGGPIPTTAKERSR